MAYKAPIWEDGKSPAISAENLNNLSQAAEGAQVLYGNSAPTSSTEGAVGQFYLVVVADSDGNYPLYQCVAIANGRYTWRDTRRIPDSITSMLGIPAPGTINRALNVLANVGNLHVWERVLTTIDASYVERRVNISDANIFSSDYQSSRYYARFNVSDSINITSSGDISLVSPTQVEIYFQNGALYNFDSLKGKYISYVSTASNSSSSFPGTENIGYVSSDAEVSITHSNYYQAKITSGAYKVYSVFVPAGTTTDYLTSTDRNAYPDNATDAQDAYYTLGDARRIVFYSGNDRLGFKYGDAITVSDDGKTIDIKNPSYQEWYGSNINNVTVMSGKFMRFTFHNNTDYGTSNPVYFMPSTSKMEYDSDGNVSAVVQPVTGHAAIPANTTITYLGQLGGGARIEVGTYVGTGTYGRSNPNSLTFEFEPKFVLIRGVKSERGAALLIHGVEGSYIDWGYTTGSSYRQIVCTWNEKNLSFYANDSDCYCNTQSDKYLYIAIG